MLYRIEVSGLQEWYRLRSGWVDGGKMALDSREITMEAVC